MDDYKVVWLGALNQALIISLTTTITECCRLRPGCEEEVIADCRLAIHRDLGPPAGGQSEEAQALRLTVLDAVISILDIAEDQARVSLGLPQPSKIVQ